MPYVGKGRQFLLRKWIFSLAGSAPYIIFTFSGEFDFNYSGATQKKLQFLKIYDIQYIFLHNN